MPTFRRSLPVLCLVLALLVSGAPAVANELDDALARQKELAAEIARQQAAMATLLKQQGSLKTQLAATRRALASTTANLAKVRSLVAALDASLARVGRELAALDAQIREIDAEIARLDAAEAQKTRELGARMAILRQRIREAYMAGRLPVVVGLLLDSGNLLSGTLDASLLTRLGEDDRRLAAEITAARAVITELEGAQRSSRASAATLRSQATARRAALAADLTEAAALRRELDRLVALQAKQVNDMLNQLDASQRTAAALAKIIAELKQDEARTATRIRELSAGTAVPAVYTGPFAWPMTGDRTAQPYGCVTFPVYPPRGSCAHWHNGLDLGAGLRTPIRAIAPGKVVIAGPCSYCRVWKGYRPLWWVWVVHSNHLVSLYGHIDDGTYGRRPPVKVGDWVSRGQVIAYVGLTGNTTGPHLHLTVYRDGRDVDPRGYLPPR
jgi:murein DD-endopeptidase MepM/ murein hydrolase activator NlpD